MRVFWLVPGLWMTFAFYLPYTVDAMSTQQGAVSRVNEHRICMNFMERHGWHISFLEEDCRTSLPLKLTFANPDKILEMYERWGANRLLEDRAAVEHGIEIGRGAIWLRLTAEQYAKLKRPLVRR